MKLVFAKIFIITAISFLLAHDIIAHHHHEQIETTQHHHDDDNDHERNVFSLGQLDEEFIISQNHIVVNPFSFSIAYLHSNNIPEIKINQSYCKASFAIVEEFPPPEKYFSFAPNKAPPTV